VTTEQALAVVRRAHGRRLAVVAELPGGQVSHATVVADECDRRRLLKWWRPDEGEHDSRAWLEAAADRAEQLRLRGYPAPRTELIVAGEGVLAVVQELLAGRPPDPLLRAHVEQLVALNELQADTQPPGREWGEFIRSTLLHGAQGYCLHEPLRRHSAQAAALLERVIAIGRETDPDALPAHDIAHFDLHHLNVLAEADRVTGIIDCEGARAGDRAFDLVTLLVCSDEGGLDPGAQEWLWSLLQQRCRPQALRAYMAHMSLRLTSWWAVHHDRDHTDRWIAHTGRWLDRCA
jgi:Ser/Thr protein kinase RdoA (MazF antagonist)